MGGGLDDCDESDNEESSGSPSVTFAAAPNSVDTIRAYLAVQTSLTTSGSNKKLGQTGQALNNHA